jgi:hypothetical protein
MQSSVFPGMFIVQGAISVDFTISREYGCLCVTMSANVE